MAFLVTAGVLGTVAGCAGPTGVEGEVVSYLTGEPLVGAQVVIGGTQLTAMTGAEGKYRIEDVPVGPQRVEVELDGFTAVDELTLTIAEGVVVSARAVALCPKPEETGLYWIEGDELHQIPSVDEDKLGQYMMGGSFIYDADLTSTPDLHPQIDFLLYAGEGSPALVELQVVRMKHKPRVNNWISGVMEARWDLTSDTTDLHPMKISDTLTRLEGELSPGRYAVKRRHQIGVKDWLFPITISSPPAEIAELDAPKSGAEQ